MPNMQEAFKSGGVTKNSSGTYYFDERGNLKPEFVAKENLERKARELDRAGLKMHQLRRFFNHCRQIDRRLRGKQTSWEQEVANIAKLSGFAADAAGKSKIPREFREFLDRNVERVHSEKDFVAGFMQHFEALVAFSALYLREERNR